MKLRLVPFLLFTIFSLFGQEQKVQPLEIGSLAPEFTLPATDGEFYSLSDFEGSEILAVIFTCNHCPTAQAYEDKIKQIVEIYKKNGVAFVAISPNDPEAISLSELGYSDLNDDLKDMKIRAEQEEFNFPYLYDGDDQKISMKYGPVATPHVFVFDKERRLQYRGRIDDNENPYVDPKSTDLKNALDQLLDGKEVEVPVTKTFGCSVKWSWKGDWTEKLKQQWKEEPVSLEDIRTNKVAGLVENSGGNLRLLNIWATWCGPCVVEFPSLVDINRMYRGRDFEFISLSTDKMNKKGQALKMLKKFQASNQNFIYQGENIYELIDAVDPEWQGSLPYTALIAPGGEIIYSIEGAIEPMELKREIINYLGRYYADD